MFHLTADIWNIEIRYIFEFFITGISDVLGNQRVPISCRFCDIVFYIAHNGLTILASPIGYGNHFLYFGLYRAPITREFL